MYVSDETSRSHKACKIDEFPVRYCQNYFVISQKGKQDVPCSTDKVENVCLFV